MADRFARAGIALLAAAGILALAGWLDGQEREVESPLQSGDGGP